MKAVTVQGPVDVDDLGNVMMHEHALHGDIDDPVWFVPLPGPRGQELADRPVTMDVLGVLWRSPLAIRDNNRLTTRDPIEAELADYKAAGGGCIVELTNRGLTPDPVGLRELSAASGVHIVAGTGFYVGSVQPPEVARMTAEELARFIISDLRDGIDGTGVRAGIIGEVGISEQLTAWEERSLVASALAANETGAAVMVHLAPHGEMAFPVFEALTREGVPPDRIVMNHIDEANDIDYARRILQLGCLIEFDAFGLECYFDSRGYWEPRDHERIVALATLCEEGHASQITLSQDVYWKQQLISFGGQGYGYVLRTMRPLLLDAGVADHEFELMVSDTPKRLLGIEE